MKKILAGFTAFATVLIVLPMFAAFEAHVINVTATIENALEVPLSHIDFGTVFPQEKLIKELPVRLSGSFMLEDRVDDVEYFIRQKPKCGVTTNGGTVLVGPTATGHVVPNANGGYTVDCGPDPRQKDDAGNPLPVGSSWGVLPSLCEYLSKHENTTDGTETNNDGELNAFHQPFTIGDNPATTVVETDYINWTDTKGRLTKGGGDPDDLWLIDLAVPCFGGYCAQDWESFVVSVAGTGALPASQWTQPITNEHKVFGCDLWLEVNGVSPAPYVNPNPPQPTG